ncbi:BMP-binding endothelial regulator protein-like [Saccoglossus kowalevskii]|uniref:Mucin-5B-like n=1 Tax=Saccoglossus kowalevskii TaxID=10224 RepID=A0ABM0M4Y2_SACKO|nr:PREDICTED: mucin-5B-like [Saccoglossus kowalevskii]
MCGWLLLTLLLAYNGSGTLAKKRAIDYTASNIIERMARYNIIVSHQRLGDCSYDINFRRADNTPPAYDMMIHYAIDDSVYLLEVPVDTGSILIPAEAETVTLNWFPPDGFVLPFDVSGVTQISNATGGTVEQHTMADGPCTPARTRGDPHLRTFDGHGYSFQGLCWYTLAKHCTDNPDFEVTAEFTPRESSGTELKTRAVRLNVTVGDEVISMDTNNDVTINGNSLWVAKLRGQPKNAQITVDDSRVIVRVAQYNLDILWEGRKHAFSASIYHPDYNGNICGLLGNADGNPLNDFQKRDGSHTKVVNDFGESWKVYDSRCDY